MTGDPIQDLFVRFGADLTPFQEGVAEVVSGSDKANGAMKAVAETTDEFFAKLNQGLDEKFGTSLNDAGAAAAKTAEEVQKAKDALDDFFASNPAKGTGPMTSPIPPNALPDVMNLEQAFARLGITSAETLRQQAADAKTAYDTILGSGKASISELQLAWIAMEEKRQQATIASGEIVTKAERDMLEQAKAPIEELKQQYTSLADQMKDIGGSLVDVGKGLSAVITIPLAGLATAAVAAASDIQGALNELRARSDPAEFASLGASFQNIFATVPANAKSAADAVSILAERLGLTGPALEALATQELNFARITGSDVGPLADATARMFNNWTIATSGQSAALDYMLNVSRNTGTGIQKLAGDLTTTGPVLREMGFNFDQAAVMLGQLDKEGVNSSAVTMALKTAMSKLAGEGIAPSIDVFNTLVARIKDSDEATGLWTAKVLFGQRAGVTLFETIRSGKLDFDELTAKVDASTDTINKTASETLTLTTAWQHFRNELESSLAPLGQVLISAMRDGLAAMEPVLTIIKELTTWFAGLPKPVQEGAVAIAAVAAVAGPAAIGIGLLMQAVSASINGWTTLLPLMARGGEALLGLAANPLAIGGGVLIGAAAIASIYVTMKNLDDLQAKWDHWQLSQTSDVQLAKSGKSGDRYLQPWTADMGQAATAGLGLKVVIDGVTSAQSKNAAATADVNAALDNLINGKGQDAAKAWKEFVDQETKMAAPFGNAASSRFSPETVALVGEYTSAMKGNKTAVDNVALAYANMAGNADNSAAALHRVLLAWQGFMSGGWDQLQEKLDGSMGKIAAAVQLPSVTFKWDAITQGFDEIQNKAKGVTGGVQQMIAGFMEANEKGLPPLDALKEALKGLGIKIDEVTGEATTKTLQFWHTVAGQGTLDEVEAAWAKVSGAVTKLAKTDLPLAAQEQQKYMEALVRAGASQNEVTQAWIAAEETKVKAARMAGQEISADEEEQLVMAKRRLADSMMSTEDAFKNLGLTSGTTYRDMAQQAADSYEKIKASGQATVLDLAKGWTNMIDKQIAATGELGRIWVDMEKQMSSGLADAIVNGKNFGDVMINVLKSIAKTIMEDLIHVAFAELGKTIFGIQGQLGTLGGTLGSLGGILNGGGSGVPITGTTPLPNLGPIGGTGPGSLASIIGGPGQWTDATGQTPADWGFSMGGAGGDASGGLSGMLGDLNPVTGIINSVVGIASGIVSGIQGARTNNLLAEIEKSTRYMEIETGLGVVPTLAAFLPRLGEIHDFFFNWAQGVWWDMHEYARDTRDHLMGGGAIAAATSSIGVFNAPGDNGLRISPDSIGALADAITARLGGAGGGSGADLTSPAVVDASTQAMFRRFKQRGLDSTRA